MGEEQPPVPHGPADGQLVPTEISSRRPVLGVGAGMVGDRPSARRPQMTREDRISAARVETRPPGDPRYRSG